MKHLNKSSVAYNAAILIVSSVILQAVGFFYRIMLSRTVGAEGMAAYQLVMSVYFVMSAFVLSGITMSVSTFSAEYNALKEPRQMPCLIRSAVLLFLSVYAVTFSVVMPLIDEVAGSLLNEPRTRNALILLFPYMLLTGIENIFKSFFYGIKRLVLPAVSEICEQIIRIGAVYIFVCIFAPTRDIGSSAAAIIAGMFVSEVFSSLFLFLGYRLHLRKSRLTSLKTNIKDNLAMIKRVCKTAMPVALSGILNRAVSSLTTVLIPRRLAVSGMTAAEALAVFGTMTGMTIPLLFLPSALIFPLTTILVPKLSEGFALHDASMIRRKCGKAIHITSLIALPAITFLIFMGDELAILIYGTANAGKNILGLSFGVLFSFYAIITGSLLNGLGHTKSSAFSVIVVGIMQLANVWFVVGTFKFGIRGYIIGEAVSELVGFIINMRRLKKITGLHINIDNWFVTPLLGALLSGFAASALFARLRLCLFPVPPSLLAAGVFAVLIYAAVLRLRGVHFGAYLKNTLLCGH